MRMTTERPAALMLFAAGFGTRMGPLTADRPKPLIKVAGRALIDRALDTVAGAEAGAGTVVVNLHYKAQMIRDHLAGRKVAFSDETGAILETGGGLRKALPLLNHDPVYTLNADAVWSCPNPLDLLARAWDGARMEALLLLIPRARATGHRGDGDFRLSEAGQITRGAGMVYSGAQIIRTGGLAEVSEQAFSLNALWDRMIARGGLFGLPYPGRWCDVGTPEGVSLAEAMLAEEDAADA